MNNNNNSHHNKTTSSPSTHHHSHKGGATGSTSGQACAACKYQRRKCAPDCILAPYFPHDRQRQFLNAHKLFGVSNITKIIRKLDQSQKDEAMRTIIFQSDVRAHDPVGGCYRVIKELQRQIEFCQAELTFVLHQLALCRAQSQQSVSQNDNQNRINNIDGHDDPDPAMLEFSSNEHEHKHNNQELQSPHDDQIQGYDIFGQIGHLHLNDDDDDDHIGPLHEVDSWGIQNSGSGSLEVKQPSSSVHNECEEIKQLLLNDLDIPIDEQHSFRFEFDETTQPPCRDKIDFHDETALIKQQNGSFKQDHDLKGAATLFSLTNCTSY